MRVPLNDSSVLPSYQDVVPGKTKKNGDSHWNQVDQSRKLY